MTYQDKNTFFGSMTGVSGEIYDRDQVASRFSANTADANKAQDTLQLSGNVDLSSEKPASHLHCRSLAWDPAQRVVKATGNVTLETPSYDLGPVPELWATPNLSQAGTPSEFQSMLKRPKNRP